MMETTPEMEVNALQLHPPVQGTEKIYGWYPPAYSQFAKPSYKQPSTYDEEARFRHQASHFHNPPTQEGIYRQPTIMSQRSSDSPARPASALSAKMDGIRQELLRRQLETPLFRRLGPDRPPTGSGFNYQSERARKTQRPVFTAVPTAWCAGQRYPEPDLRRCSPVLIHENSRPSTAASVSLPPSPSGPSVPQAASAEVRPASPLPADTNSAERRLDRRTGRPKTAPALLRKQSPHPPPKSPMKPQTSYQRQVAAMAALVPQATELQPPIVAAEEKDETEEKTEKEEKGEKTPEGVVDEEAMEEKQEFLTVDDILDDPYDKALKMYGWRMEVHGDPLRIKSKFLQKRLPYTVKIPEPKVMAQPPKMVKENRDTFFQRTMPNGALTFDINPDFTSERFNAKRQELQRKGQWNYAYRDFSFVY